MTNRKKAEGITRTMNQMALDPCPLSFESPESSTIRGAIYAPDVREMVVTFKYKGKPGAPPPPDKLYLYVGIPPELWREFCQSPSKGSFFSERIRPFHVGKMLKA